MNDQKQLHWLVRPSTIRILWIGFSVVLTLLVLAQTVIYVKGYFGFDAFFSFGAIYGFASCLVMVLVAKLLGLVLKRPQDYYDIELQDDTPEPTNDKVVKHDKVEEGNHGV
jgi:hypothetical protein